MDPITFILLYKALVRPHVEYANSVWSPYKKGNIEAVAAPEIYSCRGTTGALQSLTGHTS